jgi:hypothetical protein
MTTFIRPTFTDRHIEVRAGEDEVAIYGTRHGLQVLAKLCVELANRTLRDTEHIHVEDFELLTPQSKKLVIAVFESTD